jgi:hypothetical protein
MTTTATHHMLLLPPPVADGMTSTELRAEIAEVFPEHDQAAAIAYTEGAGRALMLAGMPGDDVSDFLSRWSGNDVRMYVGTLYGVANMKEREFAERFSSTAKLVMSTPGMTQ